jgi:hypothetical protein
MKYLLAIFLFNISLSTDPVTKIAKANALKKEAKKAYDQENFEQSVSSYQYLLDSLQILDDRARLNLAHAAYRVSYGSDHFDMLSDIAQGSQRIQDSASLNSVANEIKYFDIADQNYRIAKESADDLVASMAQNQLGVIAYRRNEISQDDKTTLLNQSLADFKGALIKNPYNEQARYNYELVKKLLQQQQEQQNQDQQNQDQQNQDQQNQDQQNQDQQNQEQQNQEQQNQDQQNQDQQNQDQQNQDQQDQDQQDQDQQDQDQQDQDQQNQPEENDPMEKLMEKLKEMNIPLEKAQMILEAMKNNEIQYVQQKKRKATKPKKNNKPDW